MEPHYDIVIIGAGAAGMMAAIQARRANPSRTVLVLDGARTLGAKILISGGGRCNVTHHHVDESAFAGSSRKAIRKVLLQFPAAATVSFFRDLGIELKREETGKLFPTTDRARDILEALVAEVESRGGVIEYPRRVDTIERNEDRFRVAGDWGEVLATRAIVATGGMSLPKSGSDGFGYELVQRLGHTLTPRVFPALVPLLLADGHALLGLSGVTVEATLDVRSSTGRVVASFTNSTLCTHFGLSGPSVLDISRYYQHALADDAGAHLTIHWLPGTRAEKLDADLRSAGTQTPLTFLRARLPERLAMTICVASGVDPIARLGELRREARRALVNAVTAMPLPVTGTRGYNFAEVTAGGVPLSEIRLDTMSSRVCDGLHLCGEICDVDGRIGGFNFQWAWASGFLAGRAAGSENP